MRHEVGVEPGDAPEPDDIGEAGADQAEVGDADEIVRREASERRQGLALAGIAIARWRNGCAALPAQKMPVSSITMRRRCC